jgi:hypothetical protein
MLIELSKANAPMLECGCRHLDVGMRMMNLHGIDLLVVKHVLGLTRHGATRAPALRQNKDQALDSRHHGGGVG